MLSKAIRKFNKIRRRKWCMLSTGEKVIKALWTALKVAIIIRLALYALSFAIAFAFVAAICDGFGEAATGQMYRDYEYRNRRYY